MRYLTSSGGKGLWLKCNPDPPTLALFIFLSFFFVQFPLLFRAFLPSFPKILGVPQREEPSLLLLLAFFPDKQGLEGQRQGSPPEMGGRIMEEESEACGGRRAGLLKKQGGRG